MRHNKHEDTNQLLLLLDEMLRQGAITSTEYIQLNTCLTEDSDDEEQNLMKSAGDYIIQHDKE